MNVKHLPDDSVSLYGFYTGTKREWQKVPVIKAEVCSDQMVADFGAKSKTSVQGGGGLRPRWKSKDGTIYEWDFQHGAVEKYNKRGKHLGEFDHETGTQNKAADPTRKVEP